MKLKYPVSFTTVASAALFFGPSPSGKAQSILLTAENFVLLGGTAVSVAGAGPDVFSNGDVGAAASISGFPPATIVNGTQMTGGVIVGQALNDLITARNGLSAMVSPPANNLTGVLGGDLATQILTPGVYKFDVAATLSLNGVLTLDAQGKNNVVWVFNIGTALTTGANAQVQFINLGTNGGKDNGLFWNAGTAFTFGANNVIAGNYLAGTDITFGTTVPAAGSASGRALALAGVSFDGSATLDVLGGPGNGDLAGGLAFNGGLVTSSGYVLLSGNGAYAQGGSSVVLTPGSIYNTAGIVIDGASSDTPGNNATLTVFKTIAALTGVNTYTGGTIVDSGTLTAAAGNLPTNGNISLIDSNGTGTAGKIVFDQSTAGTFGGVISGTGSVTKDNVGALTLTGANTYSGGTTVNGGTLIATTSSLPGNVALANNSGLVFDQAAAGTFSGVVSGAGSLTKDNVGALTLTGANTYTGGTTVNGGTLIASTSSLPGNVALANNSGLVFDQAVAGTFAGIVSGTGSVTKKNVGVLTLAGVNTYTGTTTINAGTLAVSGAGTLGAVTNALVVDGGELDLGGTSQAVGAVSLGGGAGSAINNGTLAGSSVTSTGGSVGAVLAGSGSVTNTSGTTTLSGANTYTGGTAVNGGTLAVSGAGTLGAATSDLAVNGGTVDLGGTSQMVDAVTLSGNGMINNGTLTSTSVTSTGGTVGAILAGSGSVTNTSGTTTLSGANTYTGGTTVNGGTLAVSGAGTLGANTGDLAVNVGTLDLGGTSQVVDAVTLGGNGAINNGTLTGTSYTSTGGSVGAVLAGSGSLTNTSGTTTLTGANTFTGGVAVNGGTVIASSGSLPMNQNVVMANGSALVFDQVADGSFGGVVSGAGSLTKNSAGSLTLTGANTYTGGTTVVAGTLVASTITLPTNQNVDLAAGTTLVLNEAADSTFGGMVTGTGTIEKQGAGALTLAESTLSPIALKAGSLVLAGDVGTTTVSSGAILRGVGTINGNLFNNGTVSPGNSPGTIIVTGDFTQGAGGTFVVEIASEFSFDRLVVSGAANLDGTLQINILNGYNPAGQSFEIIDAAGGVNGQFASDNSAALESTIVYGANNVVIKFTQLAFSTFAGTPNQVAVANAAQLSPALTSALNAVPLASQMPAALNALSPQGYEVWSDIAFAHTVSLADRLARQPLATPGHDDIYFEVAQSRGRTSGDRDIGSTNYTSESGIAGANHAVSSNFTVGAFFEYTESDSGLGSAGSKTNVKEKMPGLRAAWNQGEWFATAVAGYGFDDYKSTRQINFPGTSATATSKTSGSQWLADLSAGRHFQAGPVSFSPFAGLQASGWKAKGFTETGAGVFNNTVAEQTADSLRTQLGLEVAFDFKMGEASVRPHVRGAWVHELSNDSRSIEASFAGVDYTVVTRSPERDSARLSAGVDVALNSRVSLYADYSVQTGDTTRVLGEWRGGLSVSF